MPAPFFQPPLAPSLTTWSSGVQYSKDRQVVNSLGDIYVASAAHLSAAATEPGIGVNWATVWTGPVALGMTSDEQAAMAGTSGTAPSGANKFVDNADARNTNARTPTSHGSDKHTVTYAESTDARFPTTAEKAALKMDIIALTMVGNACTPDLSQGNNFEVTATAAGDTINNPINPTIGQSGVIWVNNSVAGTATVLWGTNFKWPGGVDGQIAAGASTRNVFAYTVYSATVIDIVLSSAGSA